MQCIIKQRSKFWTAIANASLHLHLADAFIQSDLQCIQVIHLLSVCVFPGNWTHVLCAANTMLYHWATGTLALLCFSITPETVSGNGNLQDPVWMLEQIVRHFFELLFWQSQPHNLPASPDEYVQGLPFLLFCLNHALLLSLCLFLTNVVLV